MCPGRLYDLLPRPRASGHFQKPYIPRPPWVCEYLYLCVSVEVFRWLFHPEQGWRGRAELDRVPHLFQLPCGHAPCRPLLHLSSE